MTDMGLALTLTAISALTATVSGCIAARCWLLCRRTEDRVDTLDYAAKLEQAKRQADQHRLVTDGGPR